MINHKFIKKLQKYEAKRNICHIIQINFSHKNDYKMTRLSMTITREKLQKFDDTSPIIINITYLYTFIHLYLKNDQVIYYTSTGKFYENHDERTSKKEKTRKKKSFNICRFEKR